MRILAFSDWRVQSTSRLFDIVEAEAPIDLIIYGGDDVGRFGTDSGNILSDLSKRTQMGAVLAVLGNDDITQTKVLDSDGVHNVHAEPFVADEYVFLGQEGAIEGGPGLLLYSEDEIESHLQQQYHQFNSKIPILVSHVPPNGILDIAQRFGQRHIGSTSVRKFIDEISPPLTVCGHCHQFGGRAKEGDFGTVINIASNDSVGSDGRYAVVEIDGESVEYSLKTVDEGNEHPLRQLSQVGGNRLRQFLDARIEGFDDISEESRDGLLELPGVYDWHVDIWLREAQAIRNGEIEVYDPAEFQYLENQNIVLLDIETDLKQDHVWLVGLYSYQEEEYFHIFEKDDEQALLESLIEYLNEQDQPDIIYYANSYFDEKCLKRRMDNHELDHGIGLLDRAHDLGISSHNYLIGDFNRTNLNSVANKLAGYESEYPEIDGFLVGAQYTKYLLDGVEPDWETLIAYNKDDVKALKLVVDEIRRLMNPTNSNS